MSHTTECPSMLYGLPKIISPLSKTLHAATNLWILRYSALMCSRTTAVQYQPHILARFLHKALQKLHGSGSVLLRVHHVPLNMQQTLLQIILYLGTLMHAIVHNTIRLFRPPRTNNASIVYWWNYRQTLSQTPFSSSWESLFSRVSLIPPRATIDDLTPSQAGSDPLRSFNCNSSQLCLSHARSPRNR